MRKWMLSGMALLALTGCQLPPDFGSAQDRAVVDTPIYPHHAFRFVSQEIADAKDPWSILEAPWADGHESLNVMHNDPVSIIVDEVRLPAEMASGRDLAVIVSVWTASNRDAEPKMVWFQRNTTPGTPLAFADLLIFNDPIWDSEAPPRIRIRVVDITGVRNRETLSAIEKAQGFAGTLSPAIPSPIAGTAIQAAVEAAKLILASEQRQNLLDYTVQFYSPEQRHAAPGSRLAPLRAGSFILVGQKPLKTEDDDLFAKDLAYNFYRGNVSTYSEGAGNKKAYGIPMKGPLIRLTVSKSAAVVSDEMERNHQTILALLREAGRDNSQAILNSLDNMRSNAISLAAVQRVKKMRDAFSLTALCQLYVEKKFLGQPEVKLTYTDEFMILNTLNRIGSCSLSSDRAQVKAQCDQWKGAKFKEGQFKLADEFHCGKGGGG